MADSSELELIKEADQRAATYLKSVDERRTFPSETSIENLRHLGGPLSDSEMEAEDVLRLFDEVGTPATVTSNGPNYYGFVIGASLPIAAASERLALAWDQCASGRVNSPTVAYIEQVASEWLLDILDLPRESAVAFGTSATACGLSCLATARSHLYQQHGWDLDCKGLTGAPRIRVFVPDTVHITVLKALKLLGFGRDDIANMPTDEYGRVDPTDLPPFDDLSIVCLQAGEVNTGEFDPFSDIIPKAKEAGAWVHVDGAFGLWARATKGRRALTESIELADSWTTDGHKSLNTPYDSAVAICRHAMSLAETMSANASYAHAEPDAQKNLTLEFSRRGRGIGFWAALKTLGRQGTDKMITQYCDHAAEIAEGCKALGINVLNRVPFNQVLCRLGTDEGTHTFLNRIQNDGDVWFGPSIWKGQAAFRISVSSWRTDNVAVEKLLQAIERNLP